jgi:VanZ family protein
MRAFGFGWIWLTLGWLLILVVVFLSLWPEPPQPLEFEQSDKFAHVIAYLTLMLWFANIYPLSSQRLLLCVAFIAMGILLEFLQNMSEYRTFSYVDMIADAFGVLLGLLLAKTPLSTYLFRLDNWLVRLSAKSI